MNEKRKPKGNRMISLSSVVVATENQVSTNLVGEAVILQVKSGIYYGLNAVGAHIWDMLLQEPIPLKDIYDSIMSEYDVEPEQCKHDLFLLMDELVAADLIHISNGNNL